MRPIARLLLAATGASATSVHAYPEGAPWGAANPGADETCATCHYDYEPILDSPALTIEGLPAVAAAGGRYALLIRFAPEAAAVSGFQLIATADRGKAGLLRSTQPGIECIGSAGRSISPVTATEGVAWSLNWQAPRDPGTEVRFFLAASAANDDQSPLGDTIHYRSFVVRFRR